MSDAEPNADNESFDDWLVAFDQSLAAGKAPRRPPTSFTDSKLEEQVRGAQLCLEILEEVFPRSNADPRIDLQSVVVHSADGEPRRLGRFELIRELGRGGCGVVYLARDPILGREIALKVPHAEALLDSRLRNRFLREAQAAAGIDHPNVVPVYEAGEIGPICFIASAHCQGPTLAEWLMKQTAPVPVRTAAKLVHALATGVAHLQIRGVLHRDLKPSNVLLTPADATDSELGFVPRMTDFGMAKFTNGVSSDSIATHHTQTGVLLGTPAYMAPEQAAGCSADCGPATDVYGLGVVLYEVLTGKAAFSGDNTIEILKQVATDDPPAPGSLRPNLHRDLETICTKCLQKEPKRRYTNAAKLAEDLQRFLDGEPIRARPIAAPERAWRWVRRNRSLAALGAVAAFLLIVVMPSLLWYEWSLRGAREKARIADELASGALAAQKAAEETATTQSYFALLTDAHNQTTDRPLGWTAAGLRDLRQAAGLATPMRDTAVLRSEAAMCFAGFDLRQHAVLISDFTAAALAVSPDGRTLAVGQFKALGHVLPCQVHLINVEQPQATRTLVFLPSAVRLGGSFVQDGVRSLAFSPDGKTLFAGTRSGWVHRWDLTATGSKPDSRKAHDATVNAVIANDTDLYTAGSDGLALRSDTAAGNRERARFSFAPRKCLGVCLAVDGKTVMASGADKTVWLDAQNLTAIREAPALGGPCSLSLHGESLVGADGPNIRLVNAANGATYRSLRDRDDEAVHEGEIDVLSYSPDGLLVVSASSTEGDRTVKLWQVAGAKLVATLHVGGTGPMCAAFVLGGRGLVVAGDGRAVLYDVAGGTVQTWVGHTPDQICAMGLSPDGSMLACIAQQATTPDGRWTGEVKVCDVARNRLAHRRALEGVSSRGPTPSVAFSRRGSVLAYVGVTHAISVWDLLSNSEPRTWPCNSPRHLDFNPEGKLLWAAVCASDLHGFDVSDGRTAVRWSNANTDFLTGLSNIYCVAAGHKWTLAGGRDGTIRTLNAADGHALTAWRGPGGPVRCLALAADESFAIAGTQDGIVRIARMPNGEVIADLRDHRDSIEAVALADSDRLLVTGSRDGSVRLYLRESQTFVPLLTLRCGGPVVGLGLSADACKLGVLIQRENAVRVWHLDRLRTQLTEMGLGW